MTEQSLFHKIRQTDAPQKLTLIVEISKGDYNKYEYNHELGVLELDRVLYGPLFYPVNYCDVPGTWNEGDKTRSRRSFVQRRADRSGRARNWVRCRGARDDRQRRSRP